MESPELGKRDRLQCAYRIHIMGHRDSCADEQYIDGSSGHIRIRNLGRHIMLTSPYRLWPLHISDICAYQHIPEAKNLMRRKGHDMIGAKIRMIGYRPDTLYHIIMNQPLASTWR